MKGLPSPKFQHADGLVQTVKFILQRLLIISSMVLLPNCPQAVIFGLLLVLQNTTKLVGQNLGTLFEVSIKLT